MESAIDDYYNHGMELLKNRDPKCISYFEKCNGLPKARSELAYIYMHGLCGIEKNLNRALSYCIGNEDFKAQSIECEIRVFLKKESDYYFQALGRLVNLCRWKPNNEYVHILLARMYLQGLGTEPNLKKVLVTQPSFDKYEIFVNEIKKCSEDVKEKLLLQVSDIGISNEGILKAALYNSLGREDDYINILNGIKDHDKFAYELLANNFVKNEDYSKLVVLSKEWFQTDPNTKSVHTYAIGLLNTGSEHSSITKLLSDYKKDRRCMRLLIYISRIDDDIDEYTKLVDYSIKNDVPVYADIALYYNIIKLDKKESSYWLSKELEYHRIRKDWTKAGQDAARLFTHNYDSFRTIDLSLVEIVKKNGNLPTKHNVACILVSTGDEKYKEIGVGILRTNSELGYNDSIVRLKEICGDVRHIVVNNIACERSDGRYTYGDKDPTELIERRYLELPAGPKKKAIKELISRYTFGDYNTERDHVKAYKYCKEYLADSDNNYKDNYYKSIIGMIMMQNEYPMKDDKEAFSLLNLSKNVIPFTLYVAEAMFSGRGTDVDIQGGIELLSNNNHLACKKKLCEIYDEGTLVARDPNKAFVLLKSIMMKDETPSTKYIEMFSRISNEISDETDSLSEEEWKSIKSSYIASESRGDDTDYALRTIDFARQLGNRSAGYIEYRIAINKLDDQIFAYNLLVSLNDETYYSEQINRISEENRIEVDLDECLKKYIRSDEHVMIMIDGDESNIQERYSLKFFSNSNSIYFTNVFSPVKIMANDFVLCDNEKPIDGRIIFPIDKITKYAALSDKDVKIAMYEKNSKVLSFIIECCGKYEMIGQNVLHCDLINPARCVRVYNGIRKKVDEIISEDVEIDTKGMDELIIEENRDGMWVKVKTIVFPAVNIDEKNSAEFISIKLTNGKKYISKDELSGYLKDDGYRETISDIVNKKITTYDASSVQINKIIDDVTLLLIDYLLKLNQFVLIKRMLSIKNFDRGFVNLLYVAAKNKNIDLSVYERYR